MKSNEERRSKLSQICTMKTAYHQSIKRRQTGRKTNRQTKKVKVFPKEMSKDYTIYTKSKQTKAKKLRNVVYILILLNKISDNNRYYDIRKDIWDRLQVIRGGQINDEGAY